MTPEIKEILDRTRRIETRLASYLTKIGMYTQALPEWVERDDSSYIRIPALDTPISSCLKVIPYGHDREVEVVHDGYIVAVVNV